MGYIDNDDVERRRRARERVSWEEIKQRHPDEWVVVLDAERVEGDGPVISGCIYAHGPDRASLKLPRRFRPATLAVIAWTGQKSIVLALDGLDGLLGAAL